MVNTIISVVIVNWNGKEFLKECLSSLDDQSYKHIEIIFVDNSSSDRSVKYVRRFFPKIKIIINKRNLGFAEANNIGYKASKGDYVLFLNNDTRVSRNFLIELIKVMKSDKKIGGAQSKILLMDDPTRLDSVGAFLTNTGFLYHYGVAKKNSSKYDKQIDVYSAKGACMVFRREVLEKIKVDGEIFDSNYFAYFEETDMCHRVWLAGYKVVFAPKSVVYHKMGGTSSKLDSAFIQYHSFKNRINSYLKNLKVTNLWKILIPHLLLCQAIAAFFLFQGRVSIFLAIYSAMLWNLKNIKNTLAKRKLIQSRIRKIDDNIFFSKVMKNPSLSYYQFVLTGKNEYKD